MTGPGRRAGVALVDRGPEVREFLRDVLDGLRGFPKTIPCKYLYDEEGSRLFEEITELEEYYVARTEVAILEENAGEMAALLGPGCLLLEYGSGNSVKTEILLDELEDAAGYVPIDISRDHLLATADRLRGFYPGLPVLPVVADYTGDIDLSRAPPGTRAVFFPGSTIGNFAPEEARRFLLRLARLVGEGGGLLIGVDLKKDRRILERAYDDAAGVTAAFNRNLLVRINRELGADFRPDRFRHRAVYDDSHGRVEMHLVSLEDQVVHLGPEAIPFRKGETIWTESSHKYSLEEFARLAAGAGFAEVQSWTDEAGWFSVHFLTVREPRRCEP